MRQRLMAAGAVLSLALSMGTAIAQTSKSDNLKVVQHFPLPAGNEIEFDGERVYVAGFETTAQSGVHSFEIKDGKVRHTGDLVCHGVLDVAALDDGLIAIGLQEDQTECNGPAIAPAGAWGGIHLADMSNPSRPILLENLELPGGVHTLTRYPDSPYIYASLGGAELYAPYGGLEHIIDVSDPNKPRIAATWKSSLNPAGCHDVTFQKIGGKMVGFCPGQGGTEIWDASDPLAPKTLGRMPVPFGQLPHSVAVTSDGKIAAVSDEAYGGHACQGGTPLGAVWFYDISDLTDPQRLGHYGPQRGALPVGALAGNEYSCTSHNFNFVPKSRLLVMAWTGGGTQVLDVEDPSSVTEVAHYRPDGAVAMSSYWYRGSIYVADLRRGLEVLKLSR